MADEKAYEKYPRRKRHAIHDLGEILASKVLLDDVIRY